jgi:hypothetical protein
MTDVHRALAEIRSIRGQMARGTEFRGYGPSALSATGLLAICAALMQIHWLPDATRNLSHYLTLWVSTAVISLTLIGVQAVLRSRRVHSGLAMEMVRSAMEQFLPPLVAGLLLTVVLVRCASSSAWMLPGLWQVLFSLGVFASCRFLPRQLFAVGVWYLAAGLGCLVLGPGRALSPWAMGVPFGVGQLLVALVLRFGYREMEFDEHS